LLPEVFEVDPELYPVVELEEFIDVEDPLVDSLAVDLFLGSDVFKVDSVTS